MIIFFILIFCPIAFSQSIYGNCDYYQDVRPNQTYYVFNPGYPSNRYGPNTNCRWTAKAPTDYNIVLNCTTVFIPSSPNCDRDRIEVSRSGDANLTDANRYCGVGRFSAQSISNKIVIALKTPRMTTGGYFLCQLSAKPIQCKCGARKRTRIVGGMNAGENEFPMMAGMVDIVQRDVYCGATIISRRSALTAAHCATSRNMDNTALLVGDNDFRSSNDSMYAALYLLSRFIINQNYNQREETNDIAIAVTRNDIVYNPGVSPVCLPFKQAVRNDRFTGDTVIATGWGTLEFGGPRPSTLQKVDLNVTSNEGCEEYYSDTTIINSQICTYGRNKDSCQYDSGGPLLYTDPGNQLLYLVGIISFGNACATSSPSVSTRVTSYIEWIISETGDADYCVR